MAGPSSSSVGTEKNNGNGNGLLLYQYYPSYYSQKVVFAFNEKKLKFKSHIVDLHRGEQYEPSFLKLNPKGEVPVLKDGVKIIPDSRRIIDYVEDNFSNGNTPRLIPEKGSPQFQTMERMRDLLDNIPNELITFGCLLNPELTGKIRMSPQEIKFRQGFYASHLSLLNEFSEKHNDFKDYYLVKKNSLEKRRNAALDKNEVEKGLLDLEYALKEVEKLLSTHDKEKKSWLCCEKFTIADISLCVLLNRMKLLGLCDKYFKDNQFSNLQEYFKRAQQRDSFRRTMNQTSSLLKPFSCLDTKDQVLVTIGGVAIVLCAAGVAAFLIQRKK
ncbi:ganglioside-induced differentiation-associated protein 1-like [Uloborus diversus]|uniref:ganglioside-induced differentiation-associated protein 1-like n=1 Tax=Uloborus diversus TaxID=327109 RepID=UPI002409E17F|nr:ganglioside-induced differentiation-associated protein 1-like [Uloborus diversus]